MSKKKKKKERGLLFSQEHFSLIDSVEDGFFPSHLRVAVFRQVFFSPCVFFFSFILQLALFCLCQTMLILRQRFSLPCYDWWIFIFVFLLLPAPAYKLPKDTWRKVHFFIVLTSSSSSLLPSPLSVGICWDIKQKYFSSSSFPLFNLRCQFSSWAKISFFLFFLFSPFLCGTDLGLIGYKVVLCFKSWACRNGSRNTDHRCMAPAFVDGNGL